MLNAPCHACVVCIRQTPRLLTTIFSTSSAQTPSTWSNTCHASHHSNNSSSQQAASTLRVTRQTISSARRKHLCLSSTPNILATAYPQGVTRTRKLPLKHAAYHWLHDNLPVKSGSKNEVHIQHNTNYQLYNDYIKDTKTHGSGKIWYGMLWHVTICHDILWYGMMCYD